MSGSDSAMGAATGVAQVEHLAFDLASVGPFAAFAGGGRAAEIVNDYDTIATVYDQVMGIDFHAATHHLRRRVVATIRESQPLRCLDLCCGTGIFFSLLTRDLPVLGFGLDLSAGQIAIARGRAATDSLNCTFNVGDIRVGALPAGLDLVTINFDALNHLGSRAEWRDVFLRANEALQNGGTFLFDINLPDRLGTDWNSPEVIVKDDLAYIQLAYPCEFDDGGVRRRTPMIIFRQMPGGAFERMQATIEQFSIPLETVFEMLRDCGFSNIELIQDSTDAPVGHIFNKHRAFISCRK